MTQILLKARPTPTQLRDRLDAPRPDGIELYLDRVDLDGEHWLPPIRTVIRDLDLDRDFEWIVEAPIRTLGGAYFDLSRDDADHRETLRRVVEAGAAIGAVAANAHVMAPTTDPLSLTVDERHRKLADCAGLLGYYLTLCREAGLIAQVENVPPVGRMRESAYVCSAIGAAPSDLTELVESYPGLRLTVDLSHAALFLNWRRIPVDQVESWLQPVAAYNHSLPGPGSLSEYVREVLAVTTTLHVSNTRGLLGEGLGYDEGDEDLDAVMRLAMGAVPYLVTETVESNADRATGMRVVQRRLAALRALEMTR